MEDKNLENIQSIKILNMKINQGHSRCIATGLKYIYEKEDFDYVIPMDGDGEDRPQEIKEFLNNNNMKMADIGPSLRLILTGTRKSPDITSILYMLGKDRVIDRLDNALSLIT